MNNEKISKAKIEEKEAVDKCFRRCLDYDPFFLFKRLDQDRLDQLINEEEIVIIKENKRVLGAFRSTSLWERALFPISRSYEKAGEILDDFPYRGERIVFLDFLFVDPSFRKKGRGKRLWEHCFHRYEKSSFLVLLKEGDPKEFFEKQGFHELPRDYEIECLEEAKLYVKPYTKTGICSDPFF